LHDNAVKGVAANEAYIFSVCATGAAAFHGSKDFRCARHFGDAHEKIANGVAVLADGRFVSVSRDRKLRIWTLNGCEVIGTPHDHSIKCVAANCGSDLIATGSYNGMVAIYDLQRSAWVAIVRPTAAGISSITSAEVPNAFLASAYDGQVYRVCAAVTVEGIMPSVARL
jgi:WD40 repeat protein